MRTSKLRRWLVRGVLVSATAVTPLAIGEAARADWTWQDVPNATSVEQSTDADSAQSARSEDWTWQ